MPEFSDLWLQEEFSDAVIVFKAPVQPDTPPHKRRRCTEGGTAAPAASCDADTEGTGDRTLSVIKEIPGHRVLLTRSPYFKAQLQRWQQDDAGGGPCTVSLVLDHADQEPAATAVLAAMYGATAAAGVAELPDEQLLRAVLFADMLQLEEVQQEVAQVLCTAVKTAGGMSAQLQARLQGLQCWPTCLLPVFSDLTFNLPVHVMAHMWVKAAALDSDQDLEAVRAAPSRVSVEARLLAVLQDLREVWVQDSLQEQLLGLPLPAMQLLLAAQDLKVHTEDDVVYTAKEYISRQKQVDRPIVCQRLAPLVRCPHLASMWLADALEPSTLGDSNSLLSVHRQHIQQLLMVRLLHSGITITTALLKKLLPGAPVSWFQGPRSHTQPVSSVGLQYRLPVTELRDACRAASTTGQPQRKPSPVLTPPLFGVAFELAVVLLPAQPGASVNPKVFVKPARSTAVNCAYTYTINGPNINIGQSSPAVSLRGRRHHNYYSHSLSPRMAGGWDDAVWATTGLPLDGVLDLHLTVRMAPVT